MPIVRISAVALVLNKQYPNIMIRECEWVLRTSQIIDCSLLRRTFLVRDADVSRFKGAGLTHMEGPPSTPTRRRLLGSGYRSRSARRRTARSLSCLGRTLSPPLPNASCACPEEAPGLSSSSLQSRLHPLHRADTYLRRACQVRLGLPAVLNAIS